MPFAARTLAASSSAALVAGLLYAAAAPTTSQAEEITSKADGVVAGIETVGPIPTVASAEGELWPGIPPQVAMLPNGSILEGDFPLIYAKALKAYDALPYRILDLASRNRREVADGSMEKGWAEVSVRLAAGGLYEVEVESDGEWLSAGRFSVGVRGTTGGPAIEAGGLGVSTVTGSVSTGWGSRTLPSPGSSVGVGLSWSSGAGTQPGLPSGWFLTASTGSAWAGLVESGPSVEAVDTPAAPQAYRAPGATRATVSFAYPRDELGEVDSILVATKVKGGRWKSVKETSVAFADPGVDARIKVPAKGEVLVRVGLDVGQTVVWGRIARVRSTAPSSDPVRLTAGNLPTAGRDSEMTTGELPDVVTLTGWDASQLAFVRNPLGVYEQMGGTAGFRNSLVSVGDGMWEFTDTQGVTTRFVNGKATIVTSPQGSLSTLAWDGQGRLSRVTNDIGSSISLAYQGSGSCADWTAYGFAPAPAGFLCKVTYPTGESSDVGYVTAGNQVQIGLIKDPGNDGSSWGWDSRGRVVSSRSTLVSQVATVEPAAAGAVSSLQYDAQGRAFRVADAPATVGGQSMVQTIDFPAINAAIVRAWVNDPSVGNAVLGRVTTSGAGSYAVYQEGHFDPQLLSPVRVRDSSGLDMSRSADSAQGRVRSAKDAADRVTKFTYNDLGLVTKTEGPVTSGTGMVLERQYDTEYVDGQDKPLTGLRALTYGKDQFGGAATAEFWRSSYDRSALSAEWSGRSTAFSAQATGVWTPSDAADNQGSKDGWQFQVTASGGTTAALLVGTTPCEGDPCVIKDLPTGPKSVTLQISQADAEGWVEVTASPVGEKLRAIPDDEVSPGYALNTVASNNDVASGMRSENETRYDFPNPADPRPASISGAGGLKVEFDYSSGQRSRLVSSTMPSGKQVATSYWGVGETATLPGVCGSGSLTQLGQGKTVTRQDGTTVTQYYDDWGRVRASVINGEAESETGCFTYYDNGALLSADFYDTDGALIESTTTTYAVGGDPRVTAQTIAHGPAAPVSPDTSVTSSVTTDIGGREISSTDHAGSVTTTEYDAGGLVSKVTVTPPVSSGSAPLVFTYTYSLSDTSLQTVRVNGVLAATLTYDADTRALDSVQYAGGSTRSVTRLPNGSPGAVTITTPDARFTRLVDERTTSDYGRTLSTELTVVGTEQRSETRGFLYDGAGRLERAAITGTGGFASATYEYAFDAQQAAACGSSYAAGLDSLRTSGSRNGVDYRICYDAQGRPVSSTDPLMAGSGGTSEISYDGLGRVTQISGPRAATLQWGSGTTLTRVDEINSNGSGLVRTVMNTYGGRIFEKTVTDDGGTSTLRYSGVHLFNVTGGAISGVESVIYGLPGGAHVRTAPGSTATLTIPGLDGAALVTVEVPSLGSGAAAVPGSTVGLADRFGAFGEPLVTPEASGDALPIFAWRAAAAQETLPGTSSITLMGSRPYLPALGAFLAPDPVLESGNNLYGYTNGDPVNSSDTSGNLTEDDVSTIMLGAGAAGAVLGGILFSAGRFKVFRSIMGAEHASQVVRWKGRTIATVGAVIGTAGIGAVGLGTYLKLKSSMGTGESIGIAIAASLGAVGAGYLAAVGTTAVYARLAYKKWPQSNTNLWTVGLIDGKAGGGLFKGHDSSAAVSGSAGAKPGLRGNAAQEEAVTFEALFGDHGTVFPAQVPRSNPPVVQQAAPVIQAPVVRQSTTLEQAADALKDLSKGERKRVLKAKIAAGTASGGEINYYLELCGS
jgi:RHS repeat-associated protein